MLQSFNDMIIQLDMTMDQYIDGVHSSTSHPKFFPKRNPCEIRINKYMCNCLHMWRANHDIQLSASLLSLIYITIHYKRSKRNGHYDGTCRTWKYGSKRISPSYG